MENYQKEEEDLKAKKELLVQKRQELENEQDQMQVYRKNAVLDNKKIRDNLDQKQIDLDQTKGKIALQ